MKRNQTAVFLIEFLVVILFFSLSVVVILHLYMAAHNKNEESEQISHALIQAQNTAEKFRTQGKSMFLSEGWVNQSTENAEGDVHKFVYSNEQNSPLIIEVLLLTENAPYGTIESGEVIIYVRGKTNKDYICRLELAKYIASPMDEREEQ